MKISRRQLRWLFISVSVLFVLAGSEASRIRPNTKKVPDWVLTHLDKGKDVDGGEAGYVILYDSREIEVDKNGKATVVTRQILRVTGLEGRGEARSGAYYTTDTDKVVSLKSWLLQKNGKVIEYDKNDTVDSIRLSSGSIASSGRFKIINAELDARIGDVFAWETVTQEAGILLAWRWFFESTGPNLFSTIRVHVPEGWKVNPYFLNMDAFEPRREGDALRWSTRNQDAILEEDWAPALSGKFLEINVHPPEGSPLEDRLISVSSWKELAAYYTREYDKLAGSPEELDEFVAQHTSGQSSRIDRIRRLAALAQEVNYVNISLNLGRGGGWFPRSASVVCESNYGDCKDKSNMLCHLLKAAGIKAYPVIVNAYLRSPVEESWPSGSQFNHCISAIEMPDGFEGGAILDHPDLGRLLIFDPTDEITSFGDLSSRMQGSGALLLAGEQGGYVELPIVAPELGVCKRDIEAEILPNGGLVAKMKESSVGQSARKFRVLTRYTEGQSEISQSVKTRLSRSLPAPKMSPPQIVDDLDGNSFTMEVDFGAAQYGKTMGGALILFKPALVDRQSGVPFEVEEERIYDLIPEPMHFEETVKIYLPNGYRVAEYVDQESFVEEFGEYSNSITLEKDYLLYHRSLRIGRARVPVEHFEDAKAFYESVTKADQATVVLEKI
ncbi:DUF3857 domain-containing protein [Pelagicoccus albus]|uniref:DUF3857 domain-containing protein n=1 Tax=Pelagicoccus albus TaxID=415222 RepID=A0A7X1B9N0_9BACT|nr:DUF3857 domain-containing protein [Pelagicoccus albus]MBC2608102.1 DUF3857 domain-containing protein [Pelagicoccus albus]